MLWFYIALTVAVVVAVCYGIADESLVVAAGTFFLTAFVAGVVAVVLNVMSLMATHSDTPQDVRNVYQLEPTDDLGNYVNFDQDEDGYSVASYYMRVEDGNAYYNKVVDQYAEDVRVMEGPGETPRVEEWECVDGNRNLWTVFTVKTICQYVLFVPEGTVERD